MISSLPLLAALTSAALAQSTSSIISLTLPGFDAQTIEGSAVTTIGDATSYILACPTGTPSDECGIGGGIHFLHGPSTFSWHFNQYTATVDCKVASGTASCTGFIVTLASETGAPETSSQISAYSDLSEMVMPVTITAGFEYLSKGSGSEQSSQPTGTGSASGSDKPNQPTNTGSSSTSLITAGVPRVTQQAVLAGIAALAGGAMML